jgi:type IV pilus assembly protein PilA
VPAYSSYPTRESAPQPDCGQRGARASRLREAEGFGLVEVLVVTLIVGVLAAIAIATFVGQKQKAVNAQAQALASNANTAVAAYAVGNGGSYAGLSPAVLHAQEPTLDVTKGSNEAYVSRAKGTSTGYEVTVRATNGDEFTIADTAGAMARTCVSKVSKTGCDGSAASTW